jgi:hypothetical protein
VTDAITPDPARLAQAWQEARDSPIAAAWRTAAKSLARFAWTYLLNRQDVWGGYRQFSERNKSYRLESGEEKKLGTTTTRPMRKERGQTLLKQGNITRHFMPVSPADLIGLHSTSPNNTSRTGGVDIDWHGENSTDPEVNWRAASGWWEELQGLGITALLTDSNGKGGFHLLSIFDEPVSTPRVFAFLQWLVSNHERYGLPAPPETFPKQAKLGPGRYGNYLRLFGLHHTRPHWSRVWSGASWLEGKEAVEFILSLVPASPSLIPDTMNIIDRRVEAYLSKLPNLRDGQGRDDVAYNFAAWLSHDMALDDSTTLQWLERWDAGNIPPKGRSRLQEILSNAHKYAQRPYGSGLNGGTHASNGHRHQHSNGAGNGQTSKPEIVLGTDEYRVNDEAIKALSNHEAAPEVYQRGNMLVRVLRVSKAGKQGRLDRPEGTPRIGDIPSAHVRELLTRVADLMKWVTNQKGEKCVVPAHPPKETVSAIVARGHYPAIRCLEAVVESPTLRPDGTILDTPGWDAETGLLYEPNAEFPPIPQTPNKMLAIRCATRILDLVENFPFAGESEDERYNNRAAWLAALLTAMVRFAIHGPCPLFLIDANCPGTGKTLLADVVSIITTGRGMSRTAYPDDEAELRKRITSIALAGDRLMLFDNIAQGCPFGGASLDAALTGTTWQDRILGKSEMTPELPLHTVFFATGNNVMLRGDAQRRVIPCRLESEHEKPEERDGFKYPNLLEHVRANRPQYVCDGLTVLRAFAVAGSPQAPLPPFGSYEAWSRLIRQAVYWVMCADPWAAREKIRTADPMLNNLAALLEGWQELPGGRSGITIAEMLRILNDPEQKDNFAILRGALMEWSRNDKLPGAGTIGYKLRSYRKRVMDGYMLDADVGHGRVHKWKVVHVG